MAFVRLKRRAVEDPIDVLLLACKKLKTEENEVTNVFKFAATVQNKAAKFVSSVTSKDKVALMIAYGTHINAVAKKTLNKLDHKMKRTICKGCNVLLIPGDTAVVRILKKPQQQVAWVCTVCSEIRLFNTQPDYILWNESESAIVGTIDCKDETTN